MDFHPYDLTGQPLNLDLTLSCGQAFRWRKLENAVWQGVVTDKLVEVYCDRGFLFWRTFPQPDFELVCDYFRLKDDISEIYETLSSACEYLATTIQRFYGLRLLRQKPEETLYSFVCSAANSIPRIASSIEALCENFGALVCMHDEKCYYAFPTTRALLKADVDDLRKSGNLAFRAKNIRSVAENISDKPECWLDEMRKISFEQARDALVTIKGVGYKIADCVCLFALDKDESVPVDTHIRQIACRLFLPEIQVKTVTDRVYKKVQQEFRLRYGSYAGWAQQFLFYDDLTR